MTDTSSRNKLNEVTLYKNKSNYKEKVLIKYYIYNFLKRVFDIFAGLIGCITLIPLTTIIVIIRKINKNDNGPLFYTQLRIGKNGKQFKLYKYRTMCMNADEKLKEYLEKNPEAEKEYKKYKKLKKDPRITKTGHFLRKTSLDEFPQFLNVLLGNMSLVGPRPYIYREKEDMGEAYNEIIKCKPRDNRLVANKWQK